MGMDGRATDKGEVWKSNSVVLKKLPCAEVVFWRCEGVYEGRLSAVHMCTSRRLERWGKWTCPTGASGLAPLGQVGLGGT